MNKPIILGKNAGQLIPKQEIERAFALGPTCLGIAATTADEKGPKIVMDHHSDLKEVEAALKKGDTLVELVNTAQNSLIKSNILFFFGDNAGVVQTNETSDLIETPDMQPFVAIEDSNGRVEMVTCLLGNFTEYHKKDSAHTDEHHALHDDLMPLLQDLYGTKAGNVQLVLEEIQKRNSLQKRLTNMSLDTDSIILLMSAAGDILPITKSEGIITATDWGFTTKVFNNVLETKPETKTEPKSKLGGILGAATSAVKNAVTGKPPVADATKNKPVVGTNDVKTETVVMPLKDGATGIPGITVENGVKYAQCPDATWSKNQKRQWYVKNAGHSPENYKQCPKVEIKTDNKDLKNLGKIVEKHIETTEAKKNEPVADNTKDTEPKHVKPENKLPDKTVLGVIPATEKEKLKSDPILIKALDKNGQVAPSMEALEADEKKFGSLEEQTTIRLDDLEHLSDEALAHFIKQYPSAALVALKGLRGYRMRLEHDKRSKAPKIEAEAVAPAPKKVGGGLLRRVG